MRIAVLAILVATFFPQTASAQKLTINLYEPGEIARHGNSAVVKETKKGDLTCSLTFDPKRIKVAAIELYASKGDVRLSVPVQLEQHEGTKTCHFTLSPELMMYSNVEISVADDTRGGLFYHIAFVDMIDFEKELPPALVRRRGKIIDLIVQKRIARYEDSTPARSVEGKLEEFLKDRLPIAPFEPKAK